MPMPTSGFGGGEPLNGTYLVTPALASTINHIGTALDNLALAVSNDTTVFQQLTAANLAITASVTSLTTANKKLAEALAKKGVAMPAKAMGTGGAHSANTHFPGNYCWTHGHWISQHHTSATCGNKAMGHKEEAASANMMGGRDANKGWFVCT
jgi:hypothetical protein